VQLDQRGSGSNYSSANRRCHLLSDQGAKDCRDEVDRVLRVSDMLVTAHANLRERFARRALILDLTVLAVSVWLTAVIFVEPRLNIKLTPFHLDPNIWVGLLGVFAFFLSIVQLRVDWKGRSDAHKRSFDLYWEVKNQCRFLLAGGGPLKHEACQHALTMFELASDVGCQIPENEFLKQKRNHLRKVAMSRHLDRHPATSLTLLRIKMWWASNIKPPNGGSVGN
jgi:hypothetical protein